MQSKATISYQGGRQSYTFPFPYLSKQFVKVRYENDRGITYLEYNRDYSVENQTVSLRSPAPSNVTLTIYRQTPTGSLVDFNDGSLMLASELDKMSAQLLHVEEESNDNLLTSAMVTEDDNEWQGRGRRIKNIRNPEKPQDVVTLNYLDSVGVARQEELQRIEHAVRDDRNAADGFKNSAASSAAASAASESRSAQSANAAEQSRQASVSLESNTRSMYNAVAATKEHIDWSRNHIDAQKNIVDTTTARAQEAGQYAAGEAAKSERSAVAAADAARRAENAQRYVGIVRGDNLAEGAVENRHLSSEVHATFRKIGTRVVHGPVDWDTLTEPMTYSMNTGPGSMTQQYNAPVGRYEWGTLNVFTPQSGVDYDQRLVQIYYPHGRGGFSWRVRNMNVWTPWRYIPLQNEVEEIAEQKANSRVSRSGDTMAGALNLTNDTWNKIGYDVFIGGKGVSGKLCLKSTTGNAGTGLALVNPDNESDKLYLYYDHNKKAFFSSKWIGTEKNVGGIHGYVYNNNSYWRLWGDDSTRPSTAYDLVCAGDNAEKGAMFVRKFVNNVCVVDNKLIADDNNTYFQHFVYASRFYTQDWFRSSGIGGLHWDKYGGGFYMEDSSWIKIWNNKNFYTAGTIKAGRFEGKADSAGTADRLSGNQLIFANDTKIWVE